MTEIKFTGKETVFQVNGEVAESKQPLTIGSHRGSPARGYTATVFANDGNFVGHAYNRMNGRGWVVTIPAEGSSPVLSEGTTANQFVAAAKAAFPDVKFKFYKGQSYLQATGHPHANFSLRGESLEVFHLKTEVSHSVKDWEEAKAIASA